MREYRTHLHSSLMLPGTGQQKKGRPAAPTAALRTDTPGAARFTAARAAEPEGAARFTAAALPAAPLSAVLLVLVLLLLLSSCSLNRMAVRMTANALTSEEGSTAFSSDGDPELIEDALPFGLKMYESLLAQLPEHEGLLLTSAEGFVSYSHAFILTPSNRLGYEDREEKKAMRERAKKMFLRGRDYAIDLLDLRHPGFGEAARSEEFEEQLRETDEKDVEALYWAAAGWMGAISASGLDLGMVMEITKPVALMTRAFELDPDFDEGAIHTFFIQIYGSVPAPAMLYGTTGTGAYVKKTLESYYEGIGTDVMKDGEVSKDPETRARHHLERAVELSEGKLASPYVAFASTFPVANQDAEEYRMLLEEALAIDPDEKPEDRLVNVLDQRTARWMLEHIGDKFITYTE